MTTLPPCPGWLALKQAQACAHRVHPPTHTSGAVISFVWVLHSPVTSISRGALALGTHPVPRGDSGGPPAPPSGILSMAKGFSWPGNQLSSLAFHSVNIVMRLVK